MTRRLLTTLAVFLAVMITAGGTAGANEVIALRDPQFHSVASGDITVQSWECPSGDLCVWDGERGTGNRCNWTNADNDWWSTPTVCSWADDRPVKSIYNRGTNTGFIGVNLFAAANYAPASLVLCAWRGTRWEPSGTGAKMRSHRWTSGSC